MFFQDGPHDQGEPKITLDLKRQLKGLKEDGEALRARVSEDILNDVSQRFPRDPEAVRAMVALLEDPSPPIRDRALKHLARCAARGHMPEMIQLGLLGALVPLLDDSESSVFSEVVALLHAIVSWRLRPREQHSVWAQDPAWRSGEVRALYDGIILSVLPALRGLEVEVARSVWELLVLCLQEEPRCSDVFVQYQGVELVLACLQDQKNTISAVRVLARLVHFNSEACRLYLRLDGVALSLQVLDGDTSRYVTEIVCACAKQTQDVTELARYMGVSALIFLSINAHDRGRIHAEATLIRLSGLHPHAAPRQEVLVYLLSHASILVRRDAAFGLWLLSRHNKSYLNILPEPLMQVLLAILMEEDLRLRSYSTGILLQQLILHRNARDAVMGQALDRLGEMLSEDNMLVRTHVLGIFSVCAEHETCCRYLLAQNMVSKIVHILNLGYESLEIKQFTLILFSKLALDGEGLEHLVRFGGVEVSMGLSLDADKTVCISALRLLLLCAQSDEYASYAASLGVVEALIEVLKEVREERKACVSYALDALFCYAQHQEYKKKIARAGGVCALVRLMQGSFVEIQMKALRVLKAFASVESMASVPRLMGLLAALLRDDERVVRADALEALGYYLQARRRADIERDDCVIRVLMDMLGSSDAMRARAAWVLERLCQVGMMRSCDSDVPVWLGLCLDHEPSVQACALRVLRSMAVHEAAENSIRACGGVDTVTQLLAHPSLASEAQDLLSRLLSRSFKPG